MNSQLEQLLRHRQHALWREINTHWTIPDKLNKKVNKWITRGDFHDKVTEVATRAIAAADPILTALPDDKPSSHRHL